MQFLEFKLAHLLGLEFSHSKYCLGVQATPLKIHRTVGSFTKSIEAAAECQMWCTSDNARRGVTPCLLCCRHVTRDT